MEAEKRMEPRHVDKIGTKPETITKLHTWEDPRVLSRYTWRRLKDKLTVGIVIVCLAIVLYPLLDILIRFTYQGALAISIPRLTQLTLEGGLANSIVGTMLLLALSTVIAVPLGVLGGIYLAEFAGRNKYGKALRFVTDVLAGMPSIVLGYVGFLVLVLYFGWGFSVLAGAVVLAILMIPYILRTTELSIRKVPQSLREASISLGSTKSQMINRVTQPLARPGILTGIILSMSIAIGETAPLLYTAGNSNYYPCGLTKCQTSYLTYVLYNFTKNPSDPNVAYLAIFLLTSFVLVLNIIARIGLHRFSKV